MGLRRGILGGAILVAVGAPFLLQALGAANAPAYLFVALGAAFLAAWYVGTRQYVYMVPAAVLIGFHAKIHAGAREDRFQPQRVAQFFGNVNQGRFFAFEI